MPIKIRAEGRRGKLCGEQWVPRPQQEVFAFFSDPSNLERITPPFLRFRVLAVSTPVLQEGTEIRYRLRLHGLPIAWTSRITEWHPPHGFTDVQIRGPYRLWRHRHEFVMEHHGTRLLDTVDYQVPFAQLLRALALTWVERDLEQIFTYRQQVIERLFRHEAGAHTAP
jgi:ligand-binding SRPBCC domain-containing protein